MATNEDSSITDNQADIPAGENSSTTADEPFDDSSSTESGDEDSSDNEDIASDFYEKCFNNKNITPEGCVKQFLIALLTWQQSHNVSDRAVQELLKITHSLFTTNTSFSQQELSNIFPETLYSLYKILGMQGDDFVKYVCCQKCTKIYRYDEVVQIDSSGLKYMASKCTNKMYEKGKYAQRCGGVLMNETVVNNVKDYTPVKVFCFKSVITSLENLLLRDGMLDLCQKWKERDVPGNVYCDVMDGNIWKEFGRKCVGSKTFFEISDTNFGFMLNVDWFQPYKRRSDISIGVMYLVLLNLPRELRYKRENWIVVGIIPNLPKEPSTLEYFLEPVVQELQILWQGVKIRTANHESGVYVRAALISVACDIPAARKTCGFLGHSAKQGCSKCKKSFPGKVGSMNYGGFDLQSWSKRTVTEHRQCTYEIRETQLSKTSKGKKERDVGYRYTPLLELEYFDSVRFCVIDTMHNLFTGTAKHMWRHWSQNLKLFNDEDLKRINEKCLSMSAASDNGWLPKNIGSNWGAWTAYEWKAWVLTYSLYALEGILDNKHLNVWHTFVLACRCIIKPSITKCDILMAHQLFVKFGGQIESVYGKMFVTPNMHLHVHIKETLLDHSSVYCHWLFAFERCNFVMGNVHTNRRDIEIQLMRNVEKNKKLALLQDSVVTAKCGEMKTAKFTHKVAHIPLSKQIDCVSCWSTLESVELPKKCKNVCLDTDDRIYLHEMYQSLYPNMSIAIDDVLHTCSEYTHLYLGNEHYGSKKYGRSERYGVALASWCGAEGNIDFEAELKPCKIKSFLRHVLIDNRSTNGDVKFKEHVIAVVKWHQPYDDVSHYKSPITVWEDKKYINPGPASFIPVQRLFSKFAWCKHNGGRLIVSPIPPHIYV